MSPLTLFFLRNNNDHETSSITGAVSFFLNTNAKNIKIKLLSLLKINLKFHKGLHRIRKKSKTKIQVVNFGIRAGHDFHCIAHQNFISNLFWCFYMTLFKHPIHPIIYQTKKVHCTAKYNVFSLYYECPMNVLFVLWIYDMYCILWLSYMKHYNSEVQ